MKSLFLTLPAAVLLLTGCAGPKSEFIPPRALLFNHFKAPLVLKYDQDAVSRQTGKADAGYFHDILLTGLNFAWGDCSLDTATENGRFTKVGSADYEFFSVLGIYAKTTVHAHKSP